MKRSKAAAGLGWASWKESLLKLPPKPFSRTSWNFRHLFQSVNLKPALCMQPVSINASGIRTEGASAHSHRLTWWDPAPVLPDSGVCAARLLPHREEPRWGSGTRGAGPWYLQTPLQQGPCHTILPNPGANTAITAFMLTEETKAQTVSV